VNQKALKQIVAVYKPFGHNIARPKDQAQNFLEKNIMKIKI
jgi:hypothetical protein